MQTVKTESASAKERKTEMRKTRETDSPTKRKTETKQHKMIGII